jgi:hypothetical protein
MKYSFNTLWYKLIVSECALNYQTGLINRQGSPFAQFRKVFSDCPRKKVDALKWMKAFAEKENIKVGSYFLKTVEKL